jgi:hypothetical protein
VRAKDFVAGARAGGTLGSVCPRKRLNALAQSHALIRRTGFHRLLSGDAKRMALRGENENRERISIGLVFALSLVISVGVVELIWALI